MSEESPSTDGQFEVQDGKLVRHEPEDEADFEEDLTFDE